MRLEINCLCREHFHALIDELNEKLIVNCVCMCMFDGLGGQAFEVDRGK